MNNQSMNNQRVCPECGTPLQYAYQRDNGEVVYYCPEGDEHYVFKNKGGYEYAVCLYDGKEICVGVAS